MHSIMTSKSKSRKEELGFGQDTAAQILNGWITYGGIPCDRVRFQNTVAPGKDREPVSEFYIKGPTGKYLVDKITYTPHGVIWIYQGSTEITPLANVKNARFIL